MIFTIRKLIVSYHKITDPKKIEKEMGFFLLKPVQKQHKKDTIRTNKIFRHSSNL